MVHVIYSAVGQHIDQPAQCSKAHLGYAIDSTVAKALYVARSSFCIMRMRILLTPYFCRQIADLESVEKVLSRGVTAVLVLHPVGTPHSPLYTFIAYTDETTHASQHVH